MRRCARCAAADWFGPILSDPSPRLAEQIGWGHGYWLASDHVLTSPSGTRSCHDGQCYIIGLKRQAVESCTVLRLRQHYTPVANSALSQGGWYETEAGATTPTQRFRCHGPTLKRDSARRFLAHAPSAPQACSSTCSKEDCSGEDRPQRVRARPLAFRARHGVVVTDHARPTCASSGRWRSRPAGPGAPERMFASGPESCHGPGARGGSSR